jgi:redox-sensitive bicupin YhaK (pirin superfamily)
METVIHRAGERGTKDIGWLQSNFSFSFSSYAHPVKKGFGLLHTLNDDRVQPGGGFGIHPHVNMEIISVLLQGKMNHKDSMGYSEVVEKDWVQIMSAGTGLRHEEYNVGEEEVNFLQLWIEPKLQNISPRYQRRHFPREQRKNKLQIIVSNAEGTAHCWINQNATLSLGWFEKGKNVPYSFPPENKCVYVFVISGRIGLNNETIDARDAIGIWNTGSFELNCLEETAFLVVEVPVNH